jgi:hypothetical protein
LKGNIYSMTGYGSNLIVAGGFTDAGGIPQADVIARWDGSAWHDLNGGMTGDISTLDWLGNDLYIGGTFEDAHGDPLQDYMIVWKEARLSFLPIVLAP